MQFFIIGVAAIMPSPTKEAKETPLLQELFRLLLPFANSSHSVEQNQESQQ